MLALARRRRGEAVDVRVAAGTCNDRGLEVDRAVDAVNLAAAGGDLSLWGLFLEADIVVKLVMLGLLARQRLGLGRGVREMVQPAQGQPARPTGSRTGSGPAAAWTSCSTRKAPTRATRWPRCSPPRWANGAARVRVAGADISHTSVRERIDRAITVTVQREMDRLERWMIFLASVGATAPFIGLFGTVWGIMHCFSAIAAMHNTNLAVVAPGIAEALFATAIGLVAAIPAVLAYNKISTDLARFAVAAGGFRRASSAPSCRARARSAPEPWPLSAEQQRPGSGRRGRYRPLAEINVTPLVDVMLVLLIIFMVTAPLMTSGVIGRSAEDQRAAAQQRQRAADGLDQRRGRRSSCRTSR